MRALSSSALSCMILADRFREEGKVGSNYLVQSVAGDYADGQWSCKQVQVISKIILAAGGRPRPVTEGASLAEAGTSRTSSCELARRGNRLASLAAPGTLPVHQGGPARCGKAEGRAGAAGEPC
jgi:hypothetical protein